MNEYDLSSKDIRNKMLNCAIFLGEPAATELIRALDFIDKQDKRIAELEAENKRLKFVFVKVQEYVQRAESRCGFIWSFDLLRLFKDALDPQPPKEQPPADRVMLTGLDDGPFLRGCGPRKKGPAKTPEQLKEIRAKAWATRRAKEQPE